MAVLDRELGRLMQLVAAAEQVQVDRADVRRRCVENDQLLEEDGVIGAAPGAMLRAVQQAPLDAQAEQTLGDRAEGR